MPGRHEHRYRLTASWAGASKTLEGAGSLSRDFRVAIEGKPELLGSADPAFRGDASRHNPEELLLAALAGCHMLSFLALTEKLHIPVLAYSDEAEGRIDMKDGRIRFVEAVLHPVVTIGPDADAIRAEALHPEAAKICFIANSVNFPVRHEPRTLKG